MRALVSAKGPDLWRCGAALCLGRVGDDADIDFYLGLMADRNASDAMRACLVRGLGRLLDDDEGARMAALVLGGRHSYRADQPGPLIDVCTLLE